MKLIGITGGIGSGKSIVCKVFASMGIPIYEADYRAKYLINNDLALKKSIQNLLGEQAYTPTGEYNRAWVASQVFNNPDLLKQLKALCIHECEKMQNDGFTNTQKLHFYYTKPPL